MALEGLEPRGVFRFFEEMCAIPHGSGNTKAVSDWCVRFAQARGLEHYQDALNNVIIIAPASPGYEAAAPILLQGHLDMVCVTAPDCGKDMTKEGLDLFTEGDLIGARGTSLGGDDGIAVAMAMAVLDDPSLPHPRIEAVFTVDEETGMFGARALDVSPLRGRTLINLDSEEEGVFTVSCAGGARLRMQWDCAWERGTKVPVTLTVDGLQGGHSGVEIDRGRGNAILLMGRLLDALRQHTALHLAAMEGGTADNAIPFACRAEIAVDSGDVDAVLAVAEEMDARLRGELALTDAGVAIHAALGAAAPMQYLAAADSDRLIDALVTLPNGVQHMSYAIPGLPETSLNLGMVRLDNETARMTFSVRSSVSSRKSALLRKLECLGTLCGAAVEVSGEYPAWEYKAESPLRDRMVAVYEAQYGEKPQVLAIHAGLECGLLSEKLPGLDCVSCGPQMHDIHSAAERLSISSVERTWKLLLEVLKESK